MAALSLNFLFPQKGEKSLSIEGVSQLLRTTPNFLCHSEGVQRPKNLVFNVFGWSLEEGQSTSSIKRSFVTSFLRM